MKPAKIIHELAMNELNSEHQWFIQAACAKSGQGITEAMLQMSKFVQGHRKTHRKS